MEEPDEEEGKDMMRKIDVKLLNDHIFAISKLKVTLKHSTYVVGL